MQIECGEVATHNSRRQVSSVWITAGVLVMGICAASSSRASGPKKAKYPRLSAAVKKADRVLRHADGFDKPARQRVVDTKVFKGRFRVALSIRSIHEEVKAEKGKPKNTTKKPKPKKTGALLIDGFFLVNRGKKELYRTDDEKRTLLTLARELTDLKRERAVKIQDYKNRHYYSAQHPAASHGRHHYRRNQTWVSYNEYKAAIDGINNKYYAMVKDMEHRIHDTSKPINERTQKVKETNDTINVIVRIPKKQVAKLDRTRLAQQDHSVFMGTVSAFEGDIGARTVGAKPQIVSIALESCGIYKNIRRRGEP